MSGHAGSDPGWPNPIWFLVPFGRKLAESRGPSTLATQMRVTWLSFASGIVMIGVVVGILARDFADESNVTGLALGLVAAVGTVSLIVGLRLGRSLDCTDDATLVGSYRTRFFLRIAVAEVPALAAFVAFILTGAWWLYPTGAAFTLAGFAAAAPTAGHLAALDRELLSQGCARSLTNLLYSATD